MSMLHRLDRHANLVNRVADTVGADMGAELAEGRLSGTELRGAVLRCVGCAHVGDCVAWLGAHADGAGTAPAFCRNRALMARLARRAP